MDFIPVYEPSLRGNEKRYVDECLDSTWISSKGEFIPRFEAAFARAIGAPHATSVSNGTVALHLALVAARLGPGDEVIVPTLTYIASVNVIAQTGATPVLVDCLAHTWQMDPAEIRKKLTGRTRAVLAVHLYGHPCDMAALIAICAEHRLLLVEDCAEAFGSYYRGQHVGTFGDLATFSFFGNKAITTGEGGMVVARSSGLMERCYHLKTQGVSPTREYWHDEVAYNYRMTNICAAIGVAQLERADIMLARKKDLAAQYGARLGLLPIQQPPHAADCEPSHWMYSIVVDQPADRDPLREHLRQQRIETRPFFHPAHRMPAFFEPQSYPNAERLSDCGINLPSSPELSDADIDRVCETIHDYFDHSRPRANGSLVLAGTALTRLANAAGVARVRPREYGNGMAMRYLADIYRSRHFWWHLAVADLRVRWRRSYFGIAWSIIQPLGMTLLVALVFGHIFHVEVRHYAPYILSGIVVWDFFVGTAINGSLAFVQGDAYIKQCRHPLAIYTLRTALTNLIVMACASTALIAWVLIAIPGTFGWSWLAALALFPIAGLLGWACATSLAYVSVRFRDIPFALNLVLQALWFVSPVYFEARTFRDNHLGALIDYNPIYHLLQLARAPLLDGHWPTSANFGYSLAALGIAALVATLIGLRAESRVIFYL